MAGWRAIFWANIPVGLAAVAMTALLVPESRAPRARGADPVGQALVIAVLGPLAYGIIQAPSSGWLSPQTFACWMIAEAAAALLLAWESRREEPLVDLRLFRSVPLAGAALTGTCAICAVSGFLFLTSLYLQDVRGLSALGAGLVILPMPVAMAACAPLAGRIIARRGTRVPLLAAGIALTVSCAALSRLTASSGTAFLVVTYAAFGAGAGLASPAITGGVMAGVPRSQASLASGINSSARMVGQSLGVAVIGSLLAGSLRGTMHAGFLGAARPGWWVMAGCGYAVLVLGLLTTSRWARATASRAGEGAAGPEAA
jgi:predicted MFS family arabinose efflux permease